MADPGQEWVSLREAALRFDVDVDELGLALEMLRHRRQEGGREPLEARYVKGEGVRVVYRLEELQEAFSIIAARALGYSD